MCREGAICISADDFSAPLLPPPLPRKQPLPQSLDLIYFRLFICIAQFQLNSQVRTG